MYQHDIIDSNDQHAIMKLTNLIIGKTTFHYFSRTCLCEPEETKYTKYMFEMENLFNGNDANRYKY